MNKSILEEWLIVDGKTRADKTHIALDRFILLPVMTVMAFKYTPASHIWIVRGAIMLFLLFMAIKLVWLISCRRK